VQSGPAGPSINELKEIFALKTEPENTIIRIELLEKQVSDLKESQEADHTDFDTRLTKLDGSVSDHEARI
jgi:hypothetical protein